jgi:hypothetical protein
MLVPPVRRQADLPSRVLAHTLGYALEAESVPRALRRGWSLFRAQVGGNVAVGGLQGAVQLYLIRT